LGDYAPRYPNHFDKRRNMKKLYYHNRGLHWALGIEGSVDEIETQFNSLFNHGAIDKTASLQWMGDNFAYVWTTQERLKKYFKNASYHEVLNNIETVGAWPSEGLRFGAMVSRKIRERAKERYNEMINENFLPACDTFSVPFNMGMISAENPSD
tara:strand:- start:97 stop:558 length:462 start_codon:yes stop_codon:yes gene_type:complete